MTTQPVETVPDGSIRSVDFDLSPSDDGYTLEGYAAVFDSPTRITNAFEGDFTETIKRGAFARVVRANPKPKMQFDHGLDPQVGHAPIAAIQSMREDDRGLFVSAIMHDNWSTKPVRDAIKSGAIEGMSFRFTVPDGGEEWSPNRDVRTVTDVDVPELGPVVFPAYMDTTVSVRSQEFADAIRTDPSLLDDLSIGLLLASRDEPPLDDPTPDEEGDARLYSTGARAGGARDAPDDWPTYRRGAESRKGGGPENPAETTPRLGRGGGPGPPPRGPSMTGDARPFLSSIRGKSPADCAAISPTGRSRFGCMSIPAGTIGPWARPSLPPGST